MSNLVLFSIPAFVVLVALEIVWARRQRGNPKIRGYEARDTAASLSLGLMNVVIAGLAKFISIPIFVVLYEHRIADVMVLGPFAWVVLFVAEDFCYYWFHRVHHEVRVFWATHVNHHSSTRYNLSTALRQPLLTPFTGPMFWAILPLVGFPPWMVLTAQAWSLLYQFWLHTEAIDRLPAPLELVLNTPSHHRVHHGKNVEYLDKNHGGILIIWDRLFGTFAPEVAPVAYGLTTNITTHNPLRIGFHEVAAIARDVARAPSFTAKLGYLFARPGWTHEGPSMTSKALQDRLPR